LNLLKTTFENNTMTINSILWKAVQEHIDNNYNPSRGGDGIDWVSVSKDAHEALDSKFCALSVEQAIDAYKN
jgi:hypothetical protein